MGFSSNFSDVLGIHSNVSNVIDICSNFENVIDFYSNFSNVIDICWETKKSIPKENFQTGNKTSYWKFARKVTPSGK